MAGESGRISITPFTTDTPSTARISLAELSSTAKTTSPNVEDTLISTPYSTKQVFDTTIAPNSNAIEDGITESFLTIAPTESSTRETIAAVSQPRPFGFPRRGRPTTSASTISDTTRSSLSGIESTARPKVSTYNTRNNARSTTQAPRTRTRTRTRNREKSISTVDDEYLNIKDETLQKNSELQETRKDIEVVSRSRSTNNNRGSSRYRPRNSALSRDLSFAQNINDQEPQKITESSHRRYRRPQKISTVSKDADDPSGFKASSKQPLRSRNFYRASRTRLDQQTADSFNTQSQAITNIKLVKDLENASTFRPSTEMSSEKNYVYANVTEATTDNTQFLIEVTEPSPGETTTDVIEKETFSSLESSLQTTVPSFLWNSYVTTLQIFEEDIGTTLFDTTTEGSFEKSPTGILSSSEASLPTENLSTRRVSLRKGASTTPISIEQETQSEKNSNRRKLVRRLRPIHDQISNSSVTEIKPRNSLDNENKKSTVAPPSNTFTQRSPSQRYLIRKTNTQLDQHNSTPKTADVSGDMNKRRQLFERYRPSALPSANNPDNTDIHDKSDIEEYHQAYDVEEKLRDSDENSTNSKATDSRRSRTRFRHKGNEQKTFENFTQRSRNTSRYVSKTTTSTESGILETLIPTKKFDYFADAIKRGNQLQRTTPKQNSDNSILKSTSKPLVTRLVTSIVESGTTERQKISIRKKYSSLTSTTYIPKFTTASSKLLSRKKKVNQNDEILNEIPRGFSTEQSVEWSTLPIESEFVDKKVTTESNEESSSTIEIESVFSNLIGH